MQALFSTVGTPGFTNGALGYSPNEMVGSLANEQYNAMDEATQAYDTMRQMATRKR